MKKHITIPIMRNSDYHPSIQNKGKYERELKSMKSNLSVFPSSTFFLFLFQNLIFIHVIHSPNAVIGKVDRGLVVRYVRYTCRRFLYALESTESGYGPPRLCEVELK